MRVSVAPAIDTPPRDRVGGGLSFRLITAAGVGHEAMMGVGVVVRGGSRFEDVDFDKSEARRAARDSLIAEVGNGGLTPILQLAEVGIGGLPPARRLSTIQQERV